MSDPYVGEIRMFAGNFAPASWAFCNGQLMSISENEALFHLIGTTYGGDGQSTFALPDLRGRLPVGQGAAPGLTPRGMGQKFGTETVTLTQQQIPTHKHNFVATTETADSASPNNALLGDTAGDVFYVNSATSPEPKAMSASTVGDAGGNQPHSNIMPSIAMNYIICLFGIFPSRN